MREPGAWDEATGVSGASQGGVAATRGVDARPRSEDATLLRALVVQHAAAASLPQLAAVQRQLLARLQQQYSELLDAPLQRRRHVAPDRRLLPLHF